MRSRSIDGDSKGMSSVSIRQVQTTPTGFSGDAASQISANAPMGSNEDLDDVDPPTHESLSTELEPHERDSHAQASIIGDGQFNIVVDYNPHWSPDGMSPTSQDGAVALIRSSEEHPNLPIPCGSLIADNSSSAVSQTPHPRAREAAYSTGAQSRAKNGARAGVQRFHSKPNNLRCSLVQDRVAVWQVKHKNIQLCPLAAAVLTNEGMLDLEDLEMLRPREYDTEIVPSDPISGVAVATLDTVGNVLMGVAEGPLEAYRQIILSDRPSSASPHNPCGQVVLSSGKGVVRIVGAGLKSPMVFTHRLAQGFHNAPKLYGDKTVRKTDRITGVKSGLVAAGKGFGYGLYDGITGFAIHPIQGAQKEGARGFLKGFGKGLGGMVCNLQRVGGVVHSTDTWFTDSALGACGIPGNAFMGVYKQLQKVTKADVPGYAAADRIAQGEEEYQCSTEQERIDIISRWYNAGLHYKYE